MLFLLRGSKLFLRLYGLKGAHSQNYFLSLYTIYCIILKFFKLKIAVQSGDCGQKIGSLVKNINVGQKLHLEQKSRFWAKIYISNKNGDLAEKKWDFG